MTVTSDFITLENCDDYTLWTATGQAALSNNTIDAREGIGGINVYKTGTINVDFGANIDISTIDVTGKLLVIWSFFKSQSILDKLVVAQVRIYDASLNYAYFNIDKKVGWEGIFRRIGNQPDGNGGTAPNYAAITRIAVYFETDNATDTTSEGDFVMDYWHLGTKLIVTDGTAESPVRLSDVYAADVSNAWGVIENPATKTYISNLDLEVGVQNGTIGYFAIKDEVFKGKCLRLMGRATAPYSYLYLGEKISGTTYGRFTAEIYLESTFSLGAYAKYAYAYIYSTHIICSEVQQITYAYGEIFGSLFEVVSVNFDCSRIYMSIKKTTIIMTTPTKMVQLNLAGGSAIDVTIPYIESSLWLNQGAETHIIRNLNVELWGTTQKIWLGFGNNVYLEDSPWLITDPQNEIGVDNRTTHVFYHKYKAKFKLEDKDGNPIQDAVILITDSQGNDLGNRTTDINGYGDFGYFKTYYVYWASGSSIPTTITNFNPFRIVVTKEGKTLLDTKLTIKNYKEFWTLKPSYERLSINLEVNKAYYEKNENVIIKAHALDDEGNKIIGLTVSATITKPDTTTSPLNLLDDGNAPDETADDGIYTGSFTETGQIGTYEAKISTTIYGNMVEGKIYFNIATLETGIETIREHHVSRRKIEGDYLYYYDNGTVIAKYKLVRDADGAIIERIPETP